MSNRPYALILKVKQEKFPLQTFAPIRIFLFWGSKYFLINPNQVQRAADKILKKLL